MNKGILGLLIGAVGGSLTTYFVMKQKCDQRIQEEIEKYKMQLNNAGKMDIPDAKKERKEEGVHDPLIHAKSSIENGPVFKDTHRTDYSKLAKNYQKHDISEELKAGKDAETVMAENESPSESDICIISAEEYNSADNMDVTELFWYTENDIIEDAYGEEVEFRENLLGDCISQLQDMSAYPVDGEGMVYIRNDDLNTIFAVEVIVGVKDIETGTV